MSHCRAIIIRNGEIIPMSREFTPETERQRLQFLVRKTFLLLSFLQSHLPASPQPPVLPARAVLGGLQGPCCGHPSVLAGGCCSGAAPACCAVVAGDHGSVPCTRGVPSCVRGAAALCSALLSCLDAPWGAAEVCRQISSFLPESSLSCSSWTNLPVPHNETF